MTKIKFIILNLVLVLNTLYISAQNNKIDSLLSLAKNAKHDSIASSLYNDIATINMRINLDSTEYYAKLAIKFAEKARNQNKKGEAYSTIGIAKYYRGKPELAVAFFDSSKQAFEKVKNLNRVAGSYTNKGIIHKSMGKYNLALQNYQDALGIYIKNKDKMNEGITYLNIGNLYHPQGNYKAALENLYKSLGIFETLKNELMQAKVHTSLGAIFGTQQNHERAKTSFQKALELYKKNDHLSGEAESYNNLGRTLYETKSYVEAGNYYKKALIIYKKINYPKQIGLLYYNLGDTHNKAGTIDSAFKYFSKATEVFKPMNYNRGLTYCYSGMGESYFLKGQYNKSIKVLEKGKKILTQANIETQKEIAEWLSKAYAKTENYKLAYENHKLFKRLNDSIFSSNNEEALTRVEMQYEFDKQKRLAEITQNEQEKRYKLFQKAAILVLILVIIIIASISLGYIRNKKANIILTKQKQEIESINLELNEQKNLIEEQRDIAIKQKQEITDSILYAQRIQTAMLPTNEMRLTKLPQHFVLFKPQNIVSGDFFWMKKIQDKYIVIAADCTGHGVPGAFMSMLGISMLNEIIQKLNDLEPHIILEKLREKVITSLHQKSKDSNNKDGMDIALAIIDPATQTINFSGAYNPLFLISNPNDKPELSILKGDREPIGIHIGTHKHFSKKSIQYSKGDRIYLFSDGFADQFGGENNQKLKQKNFRNLIMEIQKKPITEQENELETFFQNWKGDQNQIDDLLIIGMEL